MSTSWTCRCRRMLADIPPSDDNVVDGRYRRLLGNLARADDHLVDMRRVWEGWWDTLKLVEVSGPAFPQGIDEEYRARRDHQFPQYHWDDGLNDANVYEILIHGKLHQADENFIEAVHCREGLLKACQNAQAEWRCEYARLNPQLAPMRWRHEAAAPPSYSSRLEPLAPSSLSSEVHRGTASSSSGTGARCQPY